MTILAQRAGRLALRLVNPTTCVALRLCLFFSWLTVRLGARQTRAVVATPVHAPAPAPAEWAVAPFATPAGGLVMAMAGRF